MKNILLATAMLFSFQTFASNNQIQEKIDSLLHASRMIHMYLSGSVTSNSVQAKEACKLVSQANQIAMSLTDDPLVQAKGHKINKFLLATEEQRDFLGQYCYSLKVDIRYRLSQADATIAALKLSRITEEFYPTGRK